jgi:hypothetical protein
MAEDKLASPGGDDTDTRVNSIVSGTRQNTSANRLLCDPSITFDEYRYYAELTRNEERETAKTEPATAGIMQMLFPTKSSPGVKQISGSPGSRGSSNEETEKKELLPVDLDRPKRVNITDTEWTNASRAMRTASGAACFYLITTDILGPFGIG